MKAILLVLCLLVVLSCTQKELIKPKVIVTVSDKTYTPTITYFGNENCDNLFVRISNGGKNDFPYSLEISLSKKGAIRWVNLPTFAGYYQSATYNPKDYITISNFAYDAAINQVSFDFTSTLFNDNVRRPIQVSGSFDHLPLKATNCDIDYISGLKTSELEKEGNDFQTTSWSSNLYNKLTYSWEFYSNDGYRVAVLANTDLSKLAPGAYAVEALTNPIKLDFQRFIAQPNRIDDQVYDENNWRSYKTKGTLTIANHLTTKLGKKQTFGILSFTAYDETDKPIYTLKNGQFSMPSAR
ncbi:hypothetical protein [Fibrella aquatilis]|uniref:Uncharacterized protein n=1 Tax=Fibrella aquatilis TaxID=2817059 RepID=A0A939G2S3_9BACT|nr:hypothetical protein [Fibrella aquatilis]MBO0931009.1 hypothetical protein [Fibrella aquatilis]